MSLMCAVNTPGHAPTWLLLRQRRACPRISWKPVKPQECVQEKEAIHCSITIFFTNLFLCLKPWRYPQQKQQWTRNGKNWTRFRRGPWLKSEVNQRWSMKQGRRAQKFILPHWWTCHLKNAELEAKHKKTKVELYSGAILWKMFLDLMQYLQNKDHQHHKLPQQKSRISYPYCQGAQDKQLTQYTLIPKSKWKMHHFCSKFRSQNVPETQMAKIMVQYGRPSRSSWAKSVRSSFGRTLTGKAIWENPITARLGKVPNWEYLFAHREKGLFSSVYVDDIKIAGKKRNINPNWKILMKDVALGEPTSFVDHVYLGCTQREWQISKETVENYRSIFESRIFCESYRKATPFWEIWRKHFFMVPWCGSSCEENRGTILWIGEQNN